MDQVVTNQKKPEVKPQTQTANLTQAVDMAQVVRGGKRVLQELMSKVPPT